MRGRGFRFPSRVYGNFLSDAMTRDYVLSVLDNVQTGVSEIYFHPALLPAQPDPAKSRASGSLRFCSIRDVRLKMEELGITPATYFDLDRI